MSDQVWSEVQNIMKDIFGDVYTGYVSDSAGSNDEASEAQDPFASDSNESDSATHLHLRVNILNSINFFV